MADLLKAYLELISMHTQDGCPAKWLLYLRAPMMAFNRDIDITKLTFDYDVDNEYLYCHPPLKSRTDISLKKNMCLSSENAHIYFCRVLNAAAIKLEISISGTPFPCVICMETVNGALSINHRYTTLSGVIRTVRHCLNKDKLQLNKVMVKQGLSDDLNQWVRKELEKSYSTLSSMTSHEHTVA